MSDDQKQKLAEYVMRPQTKAAAVLSAYAYFGNTLDFRALSHVIEKQVEDARNGSNLPRILASQIITLDTIFYSLLEKSVEVSPSGYGVINPQMLNLALKCQKQSAGTALLLASITEKNDKQTVTR